MIQIGDVINKYHITKEINVGGFCNSYFAEFNSTTYFLKEYTEPKETDPRFLAFYNNQKTIIERLNSMGSIAEKFVDHFVENSTYFQVKEKLNGINLFDYLLSHGELQQRKDLCVILCGIVKNLHNEGIVHQDLKPQQLMLVDDVLGKKTRLGYRFVLSDFDWSIPDGKVVELVGTIYYKSPEHYRNQTPTVKSDIFTLGIMVFEILTGRNPFDFDDYADDTTLGKRVMAMKIYGKPHELNPDIEVELSSVLTKCLDPDPTHRPDIEELQLLLAGTEVGGKASHTTSSIQRISLVAGAKKMIVFGTKNIGRYEMKIYFADMTDKEGVPVYKYCEDGKSMLHFDVTDTGQFVVSAPDTTKNHFLLQGDQVGLTPIQVELGNQLDLFSVTRNEIICSWKIEI